MKAGNVEEAIDAADPTAIEWAAVGSRTLCNAFVHRVAKLMGAVLPVALANALARWLATGAAVDEGWASASEQVARQHCEAGGLAVAVYLNTEVQKDARGRAKLDEKGNPIERHGHIAVLTLPPRGEVGTWVANVGLKNGRRMPLRRAFGDKAVKFYTWSSARASGLR